MHWIYVSFALSHQYDIWTYTGSKHGHDFHVTLRWRHSGHDGVSNHQPYDCLPNRLFRRRSKKTSKLRVTGLCAGKSPGTGEFPAQWPVTRKMSPFDDIIMKNFSTLQFTASQDITLMTRLGVFRHRFFRHQLDGSMQEIRNSIANAMELRLSCINPLSWFHVIFIDVSVVVPHGVSNHQQPVFQKLVQA